MPNEFVARRGLISSGSLRVSGSVTASFISGALAGTFPYTGLTGLPALVSSSTQIDYNSIQNKLSGVVSSSTQVATLLPASTVSSSTASSPSQGTVRVTINGVNTDVDTGLQTGDSPSFAGLTVDTNTLFVDATNDRVGIGTASPGVRLHVVGPSILANNTTIDPDSYANTVIAGAISDVSWGVTSGIAGNAGTGDSWAIGHNGSALYMGMQNGVAADSMQTYMRFDPNRNIYLVETSGNVGIGTTSPSQKLDVSNGYINLTGNYGIRWNNGDSEIMGVSGYHLAFSTYTGAALTEKLRIQSNGNVGIGTTTPNTRLSVNGNTNITGSLDVTGAFTAQTKSFKINHQTIPNKSLVYGVLEGPEHAVYVRGRLTEENTIHLPTEWEWLIDESSITVQLTPIGSHQKLYVDSVSNKQIVVKVDTLFDRRIDCYYLVHATRKDVEPLQTVQ